MESAVPKKIDKYRVKKQLGEGATASVYLASDPFQDREVAIKVASNAVMNDPQFGSQYKNFFINEASLAGKLEHPHIVKVYDAAVDNDVHYIVMEYVNGGTLEPYCDVKNLLPVDRAVEIIFKCCRALDYASKLGIIHRDIKPANIMFDEGDIKIADFGASISIGADQTQIMGVVGSLLYMSPEQINDEELSHQTDIYSMGVVLYQLLTGKLPFKGKNQGLLINKILKDTPESIKNIRTEIPGALEGIVKRAMERDRKKRYRSWHDFATDLSDIFITLETPDENISDTKKYNALKSLHFFDNFTETEIWETLRISRWGKFSPGEEILKEGKMGSSFFVIATGTMKVMKGDKLLGVLNAGDCFGEMAYINGQSMPRTATVLTTSKVIVVKVKADSLNQASENLQLQFNRMFMKIMASRLAQADIMLSSI
jgi:serine/threonine protein kinase